MSRRRDELNWRLELVRDLHQICAFPVENVVHDGQPDVCTTLGWLELKIVECPARAASRLPVDLRASQRIWHRRWWDNGGRSWTLTRVTYSSHRGVSSADITTLMHEGRWASEYLGVASVEESLRSSVGYWLGSPTPLDIVSVMTKKRRPNT